MTAELQCEVEQVGTRLIVRLTGELCLVTAPRVRRTLLKCLVEQPDAIVIDLARLAISDPATATVFSAVARQAAVWPGTPILLCAADREVTALLARRSGRLSMYPTIEQALTVEPRHGLPMLKDVLLPVSGAPRRARDLATEACARWDLPHLLAPASLIATELISNASTHAETMLDLRFTLTRRYLLIAVRDGSVHVPQLVPLSADTVTDPAAGRGMLLIDATAHRWGSIPTQGGKVVWAALRTRAAHAQH